MGSHLAIGKIFTILICLGILELIVATYPTVGQRHLVGSQLFEVFVSHLAPARARFFCPNKTASEQVHENCEKKTIGPSKSTFKVPHLHRKAIFQVKETGLANILHLGATLTHHCGLVPALGPRFPAEDGEGSHADFAFDAVVFLLHAHVGIITCLQRLMESLIGLEK